MFANCKQKWSADHGRFWSVVWPVFWSELWSDLVICQSDNPFGLRIKSDLFFSSRPMLLRHTGPQHVAWSHMKQCLSMGCTWDGEKCIYARVVVLKNRRWLLLVIFFEDLHIVCGHFIVDNVKFCFRWLKTRSWLMQVPENRAANGLADSIVEAWNLYGNPKWVHWWIL